MSDKKPIKSKVTVSPNDSGLGQILGSLESEVMEVVWRRKRVTIREVWDELVVSRDISFNTVMTVMQRLTQKGLMVRKGRPRSYHFSPSLERETYIQQVAKEVGRGLVRDFGTPALVGFLDSFEEVDPKLLDQLEELIDRRKDSNRKDD